MTQFRDLRYLRVSVDDLDEAARFAGDVFGLQPADQDDDHRMFRSDPRNYSLCFTTGAGSDAVALSVATEADLAAVEARLATAGYVTRRLSDEESLVRQVKSAVATCAPNGVVVEIVWRPLECGWRYHGPRDAGITDLASVQLACTDVFANEAFWTKGLGLRVSDWIGDTAYLALDDAHHRIALYPSENDGILGATWEVDEKDSLMRNWYFLEKSQIPVVAGPDRNAASGGMFVTARGPGDLLMGYVTELDKGPQITDRGPRQFADIAQSHAIWGSVAKQPEFLGKDAT